MTEDHEKKQNYVLTIRLSDESEITMSFNPPVMPDEKSLRTTIGVLFIEAVNDFNKKIFEVKGENNELKQ